MASWGIGILKANFYGFFVSSEEYSIHYYSESVEEEIL
jgi:hypothetical protein